ncbi:MAG: alanyl-tRNA editing protein [Treponema sp.]|jgi:Ser-tRNA(Ala) deacylase AlaX|nr:alanyl-tRNA editing protein [Treponema sp.]
MSIKLFWEDTYRAQNEAVVTSIDGDVVTVDKTVAFAYPGGQVFDTGTLGGFPILNARYENRELYYTLPAGHTLNKGDAVTVIIDWDRRYALMKLHFVTELLLVVLGKNYGRHKITQADILPDKAIVGFDWNIDIAGTFPTLNEELKKLIADDIPIISAYQDRENEKRYWEIPGLAKVPCGGTHLKRTGEIGPFVLKKIPAEKGKAALEIELTPGNG